MKSYIVRVRHNPFEWIQVKAATYDLDMRGHLVFRNEEKEVVEVLSSEYWLALKEGSLEYVQLGSGRPGVQPRVEDEHAI